MVGVDFERMGTTRFGMYSDAEWMAAQSLPITGKNLSRGRAAEAKVACCRLANTDALLVINRQKVAAPREDSFRCRGENDGDAARPHAPASLRLLENLVTDLRRTFDHIGDGERPAADRAGL